MDDGDIRVTLAVHVDDMIMVGTGKDCESLRTSPSNLALPNPPRNALVHRMFFRRNKIEPTLEIPQPVFKDALVGKFEVSTYTPIPSYPTVEVCPRGEVLKFLYV